MNKKEELISFETAKLAKEKGFDWSTFYFYNENGEKNNHLSNTSGNHNSKDLNAYSMPTQELLKRWLREIYNIHLNINTFWFIDPDSIGYELEDIVTPDEVYIFSGMTGEYEEVVEKALVEGLKLIK